MAYVPNEISGPLPNDADKMFWHYCQQRELRFQQCSSCRRFRHPPTPVCPHCRSFSNEWVVAPETGVVFSFTIVHHPAHPAMKTVVPYNIVVVDFPAYDHVRLVSNVIDVPTQEIHIGMEVAVTWETAGNGMLVPRFMRKTST
jgi:uncharacterized protein